MMVYGDPSFQQTLDALVGGLRQRLAPVCSNAAPSLDALRTLVIFAGQLEQAVADQLGDSELTRVVEAITDDLATAFVHQWRHAGSTSSSSGDLEERISANLIEIERLLPAIETAWPSPPTIKVPEGFAFYALFPEQYCATALQWLSDHADAREKAAAVVGIRSIGTSLSALVAAVLRDAGWRVRRWSIRPSGHPFERRAEISPEQLKGAAYGIVVDEGPGLSGSSMAAVAAAMVREGLPGGRISFFPGHHRDPGSAASEEVRRWWATTPRCVTPLEKVRWQGRSVQEALRARTADLLRVPACDVRVEDVGGGLWCRVAYAIEAEWPAYCAAFERPKYRCVAVDGQAVLWKFAGQAVIGPGGATGVEMAMSRLTALARDGWTTAPLDEAFGFVATPWVQGRLLMAPDATPEVLSHVGRYIAAAARALDDRELSEHEAKAALQRLKHWLYWNTREALGDAPAERVRAWADSISARDLPLHGRSGDGRLAPHEWLRTADGRLLKCDAAGHEVDHTIVGPQPLAWDAAGALVEWGIHEDRAAPLLDTLAQAIGGRLPEAVLDLYRLGYAAFRMGQCSLCAEGAAEPSNEKARLRRAAERYRNDLAQAMERL